VHDQICDLGGGGVVPRVGPVHCDIPENLAVVAILGAHLLSVDVDVHLFFGQGDLDDGLFLQRKLVVVSAAGAVVVAVPGVAVHDEQPRAARVEPDARDAGAVAAAVATGGKVDDVAPAALLGLWGESKLNGVVCGQVDLADLEVLLDRPRAFLEEDILLGRRLAE